MKKFYLRIYGHDFLVEVGEVEFNSALYQLKSSGEDIIYTPEKMTSRIRVKAKNCLIGYIYEI